MAVEQERVGGNRKGKATGWGRRGNYCIQEKGTGRGRETRRRRKRAGIGQEGGGTEAKKTRKRKRTNKRRAVEKEWKGETKGVKN